MPVPEREGAAVSGRKKLCAICGTDLHSTGMHTRERTIVRQRDAVVKQTEQALDEAVDRAERAEAERDVALSAASHLRAELERLQARIVASDAAFAEIDRLTERAERAEAERDEWREAAEGFEALNREAEAERDELSAQLRGVDI